MTFIRLRIIFRRTISS